MRSRPERANPTWAAISPDKKTAVIFARGFNLFMMDAANFELAKKKADDPAIVEAQLTTDGEKYYSYSRAGQGSQGDQQQQQDEQNTTGNQNTDTAAAATRVLSEADKKFGPRTAAIGVAWSQDNLHFTVSRTDQRKVGDLWVINALANPRPTLETYKYGMPGEENQPQQELHVINIADKKAVKIKVDSFKDQQLAQESGAGSSNQERREGRWTPAAAGAGGDADGWRSRRRRAVALIASSGDKIYFNRTSRDLKRIDIVEANTTTGETRVIVPERSNTYIEIQPERLINGGKELIHWSERDGWGHYYLYDVATAKVKRQIDSGRVRGYRHCLDRREDAECAYAT